MDPQFSVLRRTRYKRSQKRRFRLVQLQKKIVIAKDHTTQHYFFRELNSTFFQRFSAANYDYVLSFFPARQVSEIILHESSKSTENALIE
jgi:hypothetical protein